MQEQVAGKTGLGCTPGYPLKSNHISTGIKAVYVLRNQFFLPPVSVDSSSLMAVTGLIHLGLTRQVSNN